MAKIKGKWRWKAVIDLSVTLDMTSGNVPRGFISNGETYDNLHVFNDVHWTPDPRVCDCLIYGGSMDVASHFKDDGSFVWASQEYRVMDFGETEQEISDELYAFIFANATEYSPIAEKLVEVANNVEKVFEAGKQQGHGEGYDSGYDAGLEEGKELGGYNEGFEAGRTEGYSHGYDDGSQDGYNQGHKDGKEAEYDAFWDTFQNYGNESGMSYNEVFGKGRFTDANYNPKYPIQVAAGINSGYAMFNGASNITDIKMPIYHRGTNLGYLFNSCGWLKRIPALHILAEVTSFQAAFDGCNALADITITGTIGQNIDFKACTKLSKESIESILNALSDTATGKTLTLSNDAVYEAFALRDDNGNKLPYLEGIWQEYIYIKSNWTITLV